MSPDSINVFIFGNGPLYRSESKNLIDETFKFRNLSSHLQIEVSVSFAALMYVHTHTCDTKKKTISLFGISCLFRHIHVICIKFFTWFRLLSAVKFYILNFLRRIRTLNELTPDKNQNIISKSQQYKLGSVKNVWIHWS